MIEEKTFFRRPECFMTVRQLTIRGTNFEIGEQLGRLAISRYGRSRDDYRADPLFAAARKAYLRRNYPVQWERVRGVSAAFGVDPDDHFYDLTYLPYLVDVPWPKPGCSVVYYPPSTTATGRGYLSRNYDFSIGSIADVMHLPLPERLKEQLPPVMSEPYVMVWYPTDGGYASLAIHGFDILSGTLDGMNSAGLLVSILADEEAIAALGPGLEGHPALQQAVGLHELQVMRFLLDTCATADQARSALLTVKQYYSFVPCHYIVADDSGDSFIYENSTGRNVQHIIDGKGKPQAITNFQIHKHAEADKMAVGALTFENNAFWRYRMLLDRISAHKGRFDVDEFKANNACVNIRVLLDTMGADPTQKGIAAGVQSRTLWHSLYDQKARAAEFRFYLGEDARGVERRSEYLKFALESSLVS